MNKYFFNLLLFTCGLTFCQAQNPYHYSWKRDAPLAIAGLFFSGSAHLFQFTVNPYSETELNNMNASQINDLDQPATHFYSAKANSASDFMMAGSGLAAVSMFLDKKMRNDFWGIALMGLETIALTDAATTWSKAIFKRPRPYVYNPDVPLEEKLSRDARFSFFSGHTSFSAAASFFAAKVYCDLNPDSRWKIPIWIAAASIPAVTGWLRIKAGKHFPTDVVAGYLTGAFLGMAIPAFHKSKLKEKFSLSTTGNGILLSWQF